MKDVKEASRVIGIEIKHNLANRTLFVYHETYIHDALEQFRMTGYHSVSTPIVTL